jgi:hypothetical protein
LLGDQDSGPAVRMLGSGEEGQAEDVIQVEIAEEDRTHEGRAGERTPERSQSRAPIENQRGAVAVMGERDAGGVTPVAHEVRARGGRRSSDTKELNLHEDVVGVGFLTPHGMAR